ncbi:MAG: hypothetical protein WC848_02070 [Parcubacteria group bacterium]|jgi:hypothetical protein
MEQLRVLYLDEDLQFLVEFNPTATSINATTEFQLGSDNVYRQASGDLCHNIEWILKDQDFNLVVIGNNLGAGISKAKAVPETMKNQTIIVWNHSTFDHMSIYADLGFQHFTTRTSLWTKIQEILKSRPREKIIPRPDQTDHFC